jgi:hypothetical protein
MIENKSLLARLRAKGFVLDGPVPFCALLSIYFYTFYLKSTLGATKAVGYRYIICGLEGDVMPP